MSDDKEGLLGVDCLAALGSFLDDGRRKLLAEFGSHYHYGAFLRTWQLVSEQALGEKLVLFDSGKLERLMCEVWRDTFRDSQERSLWGFKMGGRFGWGDIGIGNEVEARQGRLSVDGQLVCSSPPTYKGILSNPFFPADNGEEIEALAMIHSHPPNGPSFFSEPDLVGFPTSRFAAEGGIIGLISVFNIFMIRPGSGKDTIKIYPLTPKGKFCFAEEGRLDDFIQSLNDLIDTSLVVKSPLIEAVYGRWE